MLEYSNNEDQLEGSHKKGLCPEWDERGEKAEEILKRQAWQFYVINWQ